MNTKTTNKSTIVGLGLLGLLGSIIVGMGEFFLHYSDHMVGHAANYAFFQYVPHDHLVLGHFLAVAGVPLYFLGYYHVYLMLQRGNQRLAWLVFALGILAFTVGGFWITSRAFLGTIVHLQGDITPSIYQTILDNYTLLSESLVQGLRIIILLLSIVFVMAILKGGTYYPKWMAAFNPIMLLIAVFAVYFALPALGQYIAPIAMNVVHFILFSLSIINLQINFNYD